MVSILLGQTVGRVFSKILVLNGSYPESIFTEISIVLNFLNARMFKIFEKKYFWHKKQSILTPVFFFYLSMSDYPSFKKVQYGNHDKKLTLN